MEQQLNIYEVARRTSVSPATVSRVLNNRPGVGAATRRRIEAALAELGYRPRVAPTTTLIIGVAIPFTSAQFTDYYVGGLLNGISRELLAEREFQLNLLPHNWFRTAKGSMHSFLFERRVDGLLLLNTNAADHDWIEEVHRTGVPCVVTGNRPPSLATWVDSDQWTGTSEAVRHLVALGHRRIAFIAGDGEWINHRHRREAFAAATESFGSGAVQPIETEAPSMTEASGYEAAMRLFSPGGKRPTAVLCASDHLAVGALRALRELGLSVPGDVSLISFDDSRYLRGEDDGVTAVRQPIEEIGRRAARMLLGLLAQKEGGDGRKPESPCILPTQLIVRRSTAPPAPGA